MSDDRLARIEDKLNNISREMGGISKFMEVQTSQNLVLFEKYDKVSKGLSEMFRNGCANIQNHHSLETRVGHDEELLQDHDKTLNRVTGAWAATAIVSSILGAVITWFITVYYGGK